MYRFHKIPQTIRSCALHVGIKNEVQFIHTSIYITYYTALDERTHVTHRVLLIQNV